MTKDECEKHGHWSYLGVPPFPDGGCPQEANNEESSITRKPPPIDHPLCLFSSSFICPPQMMTSDAPREVADEQLM